MISSLLRKNGPLRAIAVVIAVMLGSSGLIVAGATAAQAGETKTGSSWYCKVTIETPELLPNKKMGTKGSAHNCTGYSYKLYVQVHRVEGWTHPTIAQKTQGPAAQTSYGPLKPSGCETKTGKHRYFGQTFMYAKSLGGAGGALISKDSRSYNPCDS